MEEEEEEEERGGVAWTHSDCVGAPGGCSEEEASGELFGLKATAPEHRGGCLEEERGGSLGLEWLHQSSSRLPGGGMQRVTWTQSNSE